VSERFVRLLGLASDLITLLVVSSLTSIFVVPDDDGFIQWLVSRRQR
jgi:hypothetical protein